MKINMKKMSELEYCLRDQVGRIVDLTSILFIKSKLQCGRFAPFCNFEIYKITTFTIGCLRCKLLCFEKITTERLITELNR